MTNEDSIGKRRLKDYPLLRCIILVYDFLRLLLLVRMVSAFAPTIGEPVDKVLPYIAFMAPHALFPIAAFFLWLNLGAYAAYISLYIAGKTIGICAFIAWAAISWNSIIASMGINIMANVQTLGLTALLLFADIVTILGVYSLKKTLNRLNQMKEDLPIQASEIGGI